MDRLISVIGDEAMLFEKFIELLERQQQALIRNDAEDLKAVTAQLQQVVAQSQRLEGARIRAVEEIRAAAGAEADLNVSRICEMADAARSSQLRSFRNTILDLYSRIEETRMRNGLLIEQSLEQIRATIEMLSRIPAQKETYQRQGGVSRSHAALGVDRRA